MAKRHKRKKHSEKLKSSHVKFFHIWCGWVEKVKHTVSKPYVKSGTNRLCWISYIIQQNGKNDYTIFFFIFKFCICIWVKLKFHVDVSIWVKFRNSLYLAFDNISLERSLNYDPKYKYFIFGTSGWFLFILSSSLHNTKNFRFRWFGFVEVELNQFISTQHSIDTPPTLQSFWLNGKRRSTWETLCRNLRFLFISNQSSILAVKSSALCSEKKEKSMFDLRGIWWKGREVEKFEDDIKSSRDIFGKAEGIKWNFGNFKVLGCLMVWKRS